MTMPSWAATDRQSSRSRLYQAGTLGGSRVPVHAASSGLLLMAVLGCIVVALLAGVTKASAAPPDGRAYELVSPADASGVPITALRASLDGSGPGRVVLDAPFPIASLGGGDSLSNEYRSTRTNGGWTQAFVGPPATLTANQNSAHYGALLGASQDLTRLFFTSPGFPALGPTGTDQLPVWALEPNGSFTWISQGTLPPDPSYTGPVLTTFSGSSSDGLHAFLYSTVKLEPDAAPSGNATIYDRVGNTTHVVSKDPAGNAILAQVQANGSRVNGTPLFLASSDDGSVVAFSGSVDPGDFPGARNQLYLRLNDTNPDPLIGRTINASAPKGPVTNPTLQYARFLGMASDGSKVIFATPMQLTPDDTDDSVDIYEYDVATDALTRLSTGNGVTGNLATCTSSFTTSGCPALALATVQLKAAVSADGSHVYFASPEILDPGHGIAGQANIYAHFAGVTRFMTTIDDSEASAEQLGDFSDDYAPLRFVVTGDGTNLLLESRVSRTSYDAHGHVEIYDYNSSLPSGSDPTCLTCRTEGSAPTGDAVVDNATVRGGEAFFTTTDALVSGDTNGQRDVYERMASGKFELISSGQGRQDSSLTAVSADAAGRDVIFNTSDTLVPQDLNGTVGKVYDARIGGGFPLPSPGGCTNADCHGPETPAPAGSVPGSETASGVGNAPGHPPVNHLPLFRVGSISSNARAGFARSGAMTLSIRVGGGGRMVARALATINGRRVTVALASRSLGGAGLRRLRLTLSQAARRTLSAHGSLVVRLDVSFGAQLRTARLVLRRAGH
jgi:hypothetical protein